MFTGELNISLRTFFQLESFDHFDSCNNTSERNGSDSNHSILSHTLIHHSDRDDRLLVEIDELERGYFVINESVPFDSLAVPPLSLVFDLYIPGYLAPQVFH